MTTGLCAPLTTAGEDKSLLLPPLPGCPAPPSPVLSALQVWGSGLCVGLAVCSLVADPGEGGGRGNGAVEAPRPNKARLYPAPSPDTCVIKSVILVLPLLRFHSSTASNRHGQALSQSIRVGHTSFQGDTGEGGRRQVALGEGGLFCTPRLRCIQPQ